MSFVNQIQQQIAAKQCSCDHDEYVICDGCVREILTDMHAGKAESDATLQRVTALVEEWRAMVAAANAEGPIPHDEAGHAGRWTATEMCADELSRALTGPTATKEGQ